MDRCQACLLPVTHETLQLDDKGICNICRGQTVKGTIDWASRLNDLDAIVNSHIGKAEYDCIIPFSGGKDSTWTLYYLKQRYPQLRPLVVRFNHGFFRTTVSRNCEKTFRKLGVDVHEFTPSWHVVRALMLQSFLDKGDFCWHCHTGINSYPMQVALKYKIPLMFWGEPTAEYTAYYSYEHEERRDEARFNRFVNLGISSADMLLRIDENIDPRQLEPFTFPPMSQLNALKYKALELGNYVPWDVKRQVSILQSELDWEYDEVENVPKEYGYEKIECYMQGVRDYIKYIKRGYSRVSHLAAIDLRNKRLTVEQARQLIVEFEGKRPPSLDLFLEYLSLTEEEFYTVALSHTVSPWNFNVSQISSGNKTHDYNSWPRGESIDREYTKDAVQRSCSGCSSPCE